MKTKLQAGKNEKIREKMIINLMIIINNVWNRQLHIDKNCYVKIFLLSRGTRPYN